MRGNPVYEADGAVEAHELIWIAGANGKSSAGAKTFDDRDWCLTGRSCRQHTAGLVTSEKAPCLGARSVTPFEEGHRSSYSAGVVVLRHNGKRWADGEISVIASHDPIDYWRELPSFYTNLIEQHGWKQEPMLHLVQKLAGEAWAQCLFPSTSHESLGLSHFEFYEQRLAAPMVYIRYDGHAGMFHVNYQLGQGHDAKAETCSTIDLDIRGRIVAWLNDRY